MSYKDFKDRPKEQFSNLDLVSIFDKYNPRPPIPEWYRLSAIPNASYLHCDNEEYDFWKEIYENFRYRVECLNKAKDEKELRIPCKWGEMFYVSAKTIGWVGWYGRGRVKKIKNACNGAIYAPLTNSIIPDNELTCEEKHDEAQINFSRKNLSSVAKVVGARKRKPASSGNAENLRKEKI